MPDDETVNQMIARSEEEFEQFMVCSLSVCRLSVCRLSIYNKKREDERGKERLKEGKRGSIGRCFIVRLHLISLSLPPLNQPENKETSQNTGLATAA